MKEASFKVYVPSYHRYDRIVTWNILEDCTYVVRASEEQAYRDAGVDKLWVVEDELINGMNKTFQYIIDNAPEDVFCVIDDDIKHIIYRLDDNSFIADKETAQAELERIAQIMLDLDIGFAGVDIVAKPFGYTQEFEFKGVAGGLVWYNKAKYKAKFDPKCEFNEDCDKVLQELLVNRIILKPKYLCMDTKVDTNAGGSNVGKTRQKQIDSISYMKRKWGKYFQYDFRKNIPTLHVKR